MELSEAMDSLADIDEVKNLEDSADKEVTSNEGTTTKHLFCFSFLLLVLLPVFIHDVFRPPQSWLRQ